MSRYRLQPDPVARHWVGLAGVGGGARGGGDCHGHRRGARHCVQEARTATQTAHGRGTGRQLNEVYMKV